MMTTQNSSEMTTQRSKQHASSQTSAFDPSAPDAPAWLSDVRKQGLKKPAMAVESLSAPASAPIAVHTDAPDLPDPVGQAAPAASVQRCVKAEFFSSGSSIFAVLQTMTEGKQSDMILAQLIKRMRTQAQMLSRQRELDQKRGEISASNTSASGKLVTSALATGLSGFAGWYLNNRDVGINQAVIGAFDYWDRTCGGQSRANVAMLEQKHETNVGQLEQQRVDAASAWYEQVKDARKAAQQSIMTHVQMVGDAVNSVWR